MKKVGITMIHCKEFLVISMVTIFGASKAVEYGLPQFHRTGLLNRLHHLDPPNHSRSLTLAPDEWFEQRLDHFNALNTNVWQQRYFSRYIILHS